MSERREYFFCQSCQRSWPMEMYAGKKRGRRICTNCRERIRRRKEQQ